MSVAVRFAPRLALHPALALLLAALVVPQPVAAQAPPAADRSEIEEKKRLQEEKERLKRESEVKETTEQREGRERMEKKDANTKEALKKAQAAIAAANARQNQKGMLLMEAAWLLDPTNIDYPFNTAAFAEALQNFELEFRAHAAVKILARKLIGSLPADSPRYEQSVERLKKAEERIEFLKSKVSTGVLQVTSEPKSCEVFLDGTFVGTGGGTIDALTGQRKADAQCQGHYDTELFVNVRVGDPSTAVIKPKPIAYFGKLVLRVDPPLDTVTVFLDDVSVPDRLAEKATKEGKIVGKGTKAEPIELAARKWILRFHKDGYDRWHRRIDIPRDQTLVVEARLEPLNETIESAAPAKAPPASPAAPPAKSK